MVKCATTLLRLRNGKEENQFKKSHALLIQISRLNCITLFDPTFLMASHCVVAQEIFCEFHVDVMYEMHP